MRSLRDLLDENGMLREGATLDALAGPPAPLVVFLQRRDATVDLASVREVAARHFDTRLGFLIDKRYRGVPPTFDLASFAVAIGPLPAVERWVGLRPATAADWARADAAEVRAGGGGLALLARRCQVVAEVAPIAQDDLVALRLAAIFAQTHLGPLVVGDTLLGAKSARLRLA